jgi:elongation factor P
LSAGFSALAPGGASAYPSATNYPIMASTPVIHLRKGNAVRYNNGVCIVIEMQHKTPPNLRAFVQMSIRNLATGKIYNLRLTPNDTIESVNVSREPYELSYTDPAGYHFMHQDTFEDVTMDDELVGDVKNYLVEGQIYTLVFTEGAVASIELPTTMEMKIAEAPEGVKGDSANNVYKAAVTETGLTVQVPLFINPGDKITVKTEDGSYTGRVS